MANIKRLFFAALCLIALVLTNAQKIDKCEQVRGSVKKSPQAAAFKSCCGDKKISEDCCAKLAPLAKYSECLKSPSYVKEINDYLAPKCTFEKAKADCLSH